MIGFRQPSNAMKNKTADSNPQVTAMLPQIDDTHIAILRDRITVLIAEIRAMAIEPVCIRYSEHVNFEIGPLADDDRIIVGRDGWGFSILNYTHEGLIVDVIPDGEIVSIHSMAIEASDLESAE